MVVCSCQRVNYSVYRLDEQSDFIGKEGMFYFLPRTVIQIEVSVEKTDRVKGPYSAFAGKYLGLPSVINDNSTTYSINDLTVNTLNEPDPDKIFYIVFPKSKTKRSQLMISLKENGIIESINMPSDSLSVWTHQYQRDLLQNESTDNSQPFKMFINTNIMEKVDTLFEIVHIDTMVIQKQVLKVSTMEKTVEQRAKEASEYIIMLNDYKVNLISGYQEVNYDQATINYMVNSIDQLINEYMSLFTGKTISQTLTYNFTYTPEVTTKNATFFLFSIDKQFGLSDVKSSNENANVYIELMPSLTTAKIAPIVNHQYGESGKRKGFYYNIPEKTKLMLSRGDGEVIFENYIMINQFGVIHYLPAKQYQILYFDNSASLRRVQ